MSRKPREKNCVVSAFPDFRDHLFPVPTPQQFFSVSLLPFIILPLSRVRGTARRRVATTSVALTPLPLSHICSQRAKFANSWFLRLAITGFVFVFVIGFPWVHPTSSPPSSHFLSIIKFAAQFSLVCFGFGLYFFFCRVSMLQRNPCDCQKGGVLVIHTSRQNGAFTFAAYPLAPCGAWAHAPFR